MRDWVRGQRPPPLPRHVAPIHGEVLASYVRRLARANYQNPFWLTGYLSDQPFLGGGGSVNDIPVERLAAATGLTPSQLAQRLPDLGSHRRQHPGTEVRAACRRCIARRGILDPVPCHMPRELMVCWRHQLWIGPRTHDPGDQLDVAALPEVLRAQRRHHRLRRCNRADQLLVDNAHDHADRLIQAWTQQGQLLSDNQHRRRDHYRGHIRSKFAARLESTNPRRAVAVYPEVIILTSLLLRRCGSEIIRHDPYTLEPDRYVETHARDFLDQLGLLPRPWWSPATPPSGSPHQHDLRQTKWEPSSPRLLTRIDALQVNGHLMRQIK